MRPNETYPDRLAVIYVQVRWLFQTTRADRSHLGSSRVYKSRRWDLGWTLLHHRTAIYAHCHVKHIYIYVYVCVKEKEEWAYTKKIASKVFLVVGHVK